MGEIAQENLPLQGDSSVSDCCQVVGIEVKGSSFYQMPFQSEFLQSGVMARCRSDNKLKVLVVIATEGVFP